MSAHSGRARGTAPKLHLQADAEDLVGAEAHDAREDVAFLVLEVACERMGEMVGELDERRTAILQHGWCVRSGTLNLAPERQGLGESELDRRVLLVHSHECPL